MTTQNSEPNDKSDHIDPPNPASIVSKWAYGTSFRRASKIVLLGILSIFVLLLTFIFISSGLLLGSQTSREWLIEDLVPKLLSSSSIHINVKEFKSPEIDSWYFESLTLNINKEDIFKANKLLINFDAFALLNKKLDVIELSADNLSLKVPDAINSDQVKSDSDPEGNWKNKLFPIRIQKLNLKQTLIYQKILT